MLFSASFKLSLMCCSCLHHLLPWVAPSSFVMHHACCASCLVHVWCVYHVVFFFSIVPVSLRSWGSVRLLHGLVLLPCGISGKMTATLDITTIIAMLVASIYRYAALPFTGLSSLPKLPWTSNLWHLSYANRCLAMLPLLLSPSYSVASCRWSWRFLHGGQDFGWDITISLILLMHLHIW